MSDSNHSARICVNKPIHAADSVPGKLPLVLCRVPAGFPSPAEDYLEEGLDIGAYLVKRKRATFFMRVDGDSMTGAGIHDGDLLVIDRAEHVGDGAIIVARLGDSYTVKRLRLIKGRCWLFPENDAYQPIEICDGDDFEVWGRVTHSITSHGRGGDVAKVR